MKRQLCSATNQNENNPFKIKPVECNCLFMNCCLCFACNMSRGDNYSLGEIFLKITRIFLKITRIFVESLGISTTFGRAQIEHK